MKALVTGGSGFVGSHTIRTLLDAGVEVRALARSRSRLDAALAPHGCEQSVEVADGDITDREAVATAFAGCDAVAHVAATYSFNPRRAREMHETNVGGTELVLGEAKRRGLERIAYVSTFAALLPAEGTLRPDSPVGSPDVAYSRSKAEAERVARDFQDRGLPLTIIYPGSVLGPHDRAIGESTAVAGDAMSGKIPFLFPGGLPFCDVRDVATVLTAALTRGGDQAGQYFACEELTPIEEMVRWFARAAGRRGPLPAPPRPVIAATVWLTEAGRRLGLPMPVGREGPWLLAHSRPADASATRERLGVELRPREQTFADTAKWLVSSGRVKPKRREAT